MVCIKTERTNRELLSFRTAIAMGKTMTPTIALMNMKPIAPIEESKTAAIPEKISAEGYASISWMQYPGISP